MAASSVEKELVETETLIDNSIGDKQAERAWDDDNSWACQLAGTTKEKKNKNKNKNKKAKKDKKKNRYSGIFHGPQFTLRDDNRGIHAINTDNAGGPGSIVDPFEGATIRVLAAVHGYRIPSQSRVWCEKASQEWCGCYTGTTLGAFTFSWHRMTECEAIELLLSNLWKCWCADNGLAFDYELIYA